MKKVLSLVLALLPFLSFAHEGHGHTEGFTITHYLVEPVHVLTGAVTFGILFFVYRALVRHDKKA